jgi:tail tube protein gp19
MGAMVMSPSFVGRWFYMTLDGSNNVGHVRSVDGGTMKSEVITQQVGGQSLRVKTVGLPQIEPFSAQIGTSMALPFWDWIQKSFAGEYQRKNGAFITLNERMKPVHEQSFTDALVTECTFPGMDATSKDGAFITVKIQAETSKHNNNPGGGRSNIPFPPAQKQWSQANFSFSIDGMPKGRVNKIDPFTLKQNTTKVAVGGQRQYQIEPTSVDTPNIVFYISMADAGPWFDWAEKFIMQGKNGAKEEKTGAISLLPPNLQGEMLTVHLRGVGISSIGIDKADVNGQDAIKRAKVECYVEEMRFEHVKENRFILF